MLAPTPVAYDRANAASIFTSLDGDDLGHSSSAPPAVRSRIGVHIIGVDSRPIDPAAANSLPATFNLWPPIPAFGSASLRPIQRTLGVQPLEKLALPVSNSESRDVPAPASADSSLHRPPWLAARTAFSDKAKPRAFSDVLVALCEAGRMEPVV